LQDFSPYCIYELLDTYYAARDGIVLDVAATAVRHEKDLARTAKTDKDVAVSLIAHGGRHSEAL